MDCVNHKDVAATAFCQNCGKPLCANCVRNAPGGQVLCEPCSTAWQAYQQPFVAAVQKLPDEIFLDAFGDHVRVIATKDGFDVQEYDHD